MDILKQSALAWKEITKFRYNLTYGYKKTLYPISVTFSLEDYPHLAGFQYAKDAPVQNYASAKVVSRILEGKISHETISKASQYEGMILPRLKALVHLKNAFDNDFTLYSYMPRFYPFYTDIKADYLISSHYELDSFVFIIQTSPSGETKLDYVCCSAFTKGERDYEANQSSRILLKKERIYLPDNSSYVFFNKIKNI